VSAAAYARAPARLTLAVAGTGGTILGWASVSARAHSAPAQLRPGLLAGALGGAGYVGTPDERQDAPAAAAPDGTIAAVSLGPPATVLARIASLRHRHRLVVADLPAGAAGAADLAALVRARAPRELLIVLQRVRDGGAGELLWGGIAGLRGDEPALFGRV
jgi:hypothetical protein